MGSLEGCCICKAKSSSSRFTDSDKNEDEFENCFHLESEERRGDICNACVLIVKRWRQLPLGTSKNWAHVVDARAGPGHNTKDDGPRCSQANREKEADRRSGRGEKSKDLEEDEGEEEEAAEQGGGSGCKDLAGKEGKEEK